MVEYQGRGLVAEIPGEVFPQGRYASLVVVQDDVFDGHCWLLKT
mgnify:CR=1 FL=1